MSIEVRKVTPLTTATCRTSGSFLGKQNSPRMVEIPIKIFVIETSDSIWLYDAGLPRQAISGLSYSLYRKLLRIRVIKPAVELLREQGIDPASVARIFVSHFHIDHCGGLGDFSEAEILCHGSALDHIQNLGLKDKARGFFESGIDEETLAAVRQISGESTPVNVDGLDTGLQGWPLGGENYVVELPGHAPGHIGILFGHLKTCLVGDASWSGECLTCGVDPSRMTAPVQYDWVKYQETIGKLNQLAASGFKLLGSHF